MIGTKSRRGMCNGNSFIIHSLTVVQGSMPKHGAGGGGGGGWGAVEGFPVTAAKSQGVIESKSKQGDV